MHSSYKSIGFVPGGPQAVVQACRTLGFDQLFMPAVPPDERDMEAAGWRALGRELGGMAKSFRDEGITLGYHNHHWELKPKDGSKTALELLFEEAQGTPLAWQVDVAWLVVAARPGVRAALR